MWKYCTYCKGDLRESEEFFECKECEKRTYKNSLPAAGIIIVKDGKFLISKRAHPPKKGYYDVVGGFLNLAEHPEDGAIRETKEETGLDVKILDQIGIYIDDDYEYQGEKKHVMIVLYLAEVVGGEMKPMDDVASLHWFPLDKPPKKLAFPWLKEAMKDLKKLK